MLYEVLTSASGDTIWVNSPSECLGRFDKRFGSDVHATQEHVREGMPLCLYCTHKQATRDDWLWFLYYMHLFHGITIPEDTLRFE